MWKKVGLLGVLILLTIYIGKEVDLNKEIDILYSSTDTDNNDLLENGYSLYESSYTLKNGYTFPFLKVNGMQDQKLEKKINDSLTKYLFVLTDPWFGDSKTTASPPVIHLQSPGYLSIEYSFRYITAENKYWYFCVTVDMRSGEVIFLDDLIDIDNEFAMLVQNGRILKKDDPGFDSTAEELTNRENNYFSKRDLDYIKRFFNNYSREYLYGEYYRENGFDMLTMDTYIFTTRFYLEEESICFTSANTRSFITKIRIDDLDGYLKVSIP